jgi:hypothetical protein
VGADEPGEPGTDDDDTLGADGTIGAARAGAGEHGGKPGGGGSGEESTAGHGVDGRPELAVESAEE